MRKLVVLAAAVAALSARAEQKNVQLLTNQSDLELQRTMNMMRASLGVHCDFCHAVDEKNGWNFASDEKKEKKTAREMIAMVMRINKEQFGGRAEVSCWSCHRGSTRPVSVVSLPQGPPPFPTPKPVLPDLPSLEEVVKKYAAAIGDPSKLRAPRTMKGTREAFDGKAMPIQVQQSGARWHIVATMPAGQLEQVVNDNGGWSRDDKGVHDMSASGLENFRELAAALEPTLPSDVPATARVTGKETVGATDTVVVSFRSGNIRQRLFFDSASGLLVRRIVLRETAIGEVPLLSDFGDWKEGGGARFPHKITVWSVDPWVGSTRRYTEVKLDAAVAGDAFAKPK